MLLSHLRECQSATSRITRQVRWLSHKSRKFDILFMGRDEFSCGVLRELHAAPDVYDHIAISTHPDEKVGRRGSILSVSPLKSLGLSLNIPVHAIPHEKREFRHWTLPSPFSLPQDTLPPSHHLLVTASFGRILPLSMLSQFPKLQRLNVHPSLLPAYRGPAPIQHALMRGEKEVGVCVIQMLPVKKSGGGIDAGDVWGCSRMEVPEGYDFMKLREMLAKRGGRVLVSVLRDMIEGKAMAIPQPDASSAPYAPMITQADWTINFSQITAEEIVWRHRAISHQRHLTTSIPVQPRKTVQLISPSVAADPEAGAKLSMIPGSASLRKSGELLIRCKNGTVLEVRRVKQEGKKEVSSKEWWNGVKGLGIVENETITLS